MTTAAIIQKKLVDAFSPIHLDVVNESYKHNVPEGSESHFKVIIVSDKFNSLLRIKRHRAVNSVLAHELAEKIHALAIHAYTKKEWDKHYAENTPLSPNCLGGGK